MKAILSIIDGNGNKYFGNIELLPTSISVKEEEVISDDQVLSEIEFTLPMRAFMRKYASNSSGAARFTILLAFLAKGSTDRDIPGETIRIEWNKLTAHLGLFNRAHATRAKDRAWVGSPSYGMYRLAALWRKAFDEQ